MQKYKLKLWIRALLFVIWFFIIVFSFVKNDYSSKTIKNWDVVFLLDVSNSMNVKDVFYNSHKVTRLTLAKKIIENNVKNLDNKFWLILFSDKFDYFIPPTLDKKSFIDYLDTVNTNNLNWWKTNFTESINSLKDVLYPTDMLVLISDFDTDEDLKKIDLKNYMYLIWIWEETPWVVRNKEWKILYLDWEKLKSWFNKNKLLELAKHKNSEYKIVNTYKNWEILDFLKNVSSKNIIEQKNKINYLEIVGFVLIILSL
jgi:hypothetical protein